MCGICGFTGKLENREDVLKKMTAVITHRGPDSEGFYIDDSVNMGFRRLSIIDLDSGHQPIYNEDKTFSPSTAKSTTTRSFARPLSRRATSSTPKPTARFWFTASRSGKRICS